MTNVIHIESKDHSSVFITIGSLDFGYDVIIWEWLGL